MNIFIGENIKRLRRQKSITQEQLAVAMNVTCAAVSKWERTETYPDITLLAPLAYYFGVTVDELLGYDESKIAREIDEILEKYRVLYRSDFRAARELIVKAYADYPNDFRIMHSYMWNVGGDYADNDRETLLEHKAEFSAICEKILEGCPDNQLRMDACNMQGKLLWAEGKCGEALELYKRSFMNWYTTVGQKSEQLFAKDTPEFLYWVKRNMYGLASFAADKLSKSIFFDAAIPYGERVRKIESYGVIASRIYAETGEVFFLVLAESIIGRLANDLKFRGGDESDTARLSEKARELRGELESKKAGNPALADMHK